MPEDLKTTSPEMSGFAQEPEPASPPSNGHIGETSVDALHAIATNEAFPSALRVVAERLIRAEFEFRQMFAQHRPDEFAVGEALTQFRAELEAQSQVTNHVGQVVAQLSQQRAMQEFMAERNARATALDLAIKALPDDDRRGPNATSMITTYAEAFLGWLKSGAQ